MAFLKILSSFAFFCFIVESTLLEHFDSPIFFQYFIEKPMNQTVNEGESIFLRCIIGNRQGTVQWTRNGFAMGYSNLEIKKTCSRCHLHIDESQGIYNLQVQDVILGHDDYFECQVSPGKGAQSSMILRAPVYITIKVPPQAVTIGHINPVKAGEKLHLCCTSKDSNPKSNIVWFYGNKKISKNSVTELSEMVYQGSRNGTFTTVSKITMKTSGSDNGALMSCRASQSVDFFPFIQDTYRLTVFSSPSPPQIFGNISSELKSGDTVKIICITEGGYPLPNLIWLKNGIPLHENVLNESNDIDVKKFNGKIISQKIRLLNISRSEISLILTPKDHKSEYRCRSFAPETMARPVDSDESIFLNVTFPPEEMVLLGPSEVKNDQSYKYRCEVINANPVPKIEWKINEETVISDFQEQFSSDFKTSSALTIGNYHTELRATSYYILSVTEKDASFLLSCIALRKANDKFEAIMHTKKEITVLKQPNPPAITGVPENKTLREGQLLTLTCKSSGGFPKPYLSWFVNEKEIEDYNSNYSYGEHSFSKTSLTANREDNNKEYRCEAVNKANTGNPAMTKLKFRVFFPPKHLNIVVERPEKGNGYDRTLEYELSLRKRSKDDIRIVLSGELVRLRCEADESNPRPIFRWNKNGQIIESTRTEVVQGKYAGGEQITSILEFRASPNNNGKYYQCFAQNPIFFEETKEELTISIKIEVLFKPRFLETNPAIYYVNEGQALNITIDAIGNPPQIKYKWIFPNETFSNRIYTEGCFFTLTNAHRKNRGNYTIFAWNGHSNFNNSHTFFVDVLFPPRIRSLTTNLTVNEGEIAEFKCEIEANPFNEETVQWNFFGYSIDLKTNQSLQQRSQKILIKEKMISIFQINDVKRYDMGKFICSTQNFALNYSTSAVTYLFVNHPPYIKRDLERSKMAFARGSPAFITCRAFGYPDVTFTWFIKRETDNEMVKVGLHNRDRGETIEPPEKTSISSAFDSVFVIDNVRSEHYFSIFRCSASNIYGVDSYDMQIVKPGPPEKPKSIEITAVDDNSVSLAWIPGFNGGYNQSFEIQVYDEKSGQRVLKLKNIRRIDGNETTVYGLNPQTRYALKIRSWNRDGYSNFSDEVIIKTRPMDRAASPNTHVETQIAVVSIALGLMGVIFFAMVIYLCCFNKKIDSNGQKFATKNGTKGFYPCVKLSQDNFGRNSQLNSPYNLNDLKTKSLPRKYYAEKDEKDSRRNLSSFDLTTYNRENIFEFKTERCFAEIFMKGIKKNDWTGSNLEADDVFVSKFGSFTTYDPDLSLNNSILVDCDEKNAQENELLLFQRSISTPSNRLPSNISQKNENRDILCSSSIYNTLAEKKDGRPTYNLDIVEKKVLNDVIDFTSAESPPITPIPTPPPPPLVMASKKLKIKS